MQGTVGLLGEAARKAANAAKQRRYYARNSDKVKAYVAAWQSENKDKVAAYKAAHDEKRRKPIGQATELRRLNLKRCQACRLIRHRDAFTIGMACCRPCRNAEVTSKPAVAVHRRIHRRIRLWISGGKRKSTRQIVGYTAQELCDHLERQFLPGMGWHNASKWHIDHIVPLSAFPVSGEDDPNVPKAWALTNLRPLWAVDNMRKSNKREFLL